ncbi:MAG: single-stranded-DNA-specific exonuclease RecJ [Sphaerochaeta sp.]|jgi:single-stranded-DNA-specific exonuclease|uniref:single-stranded-DNA-specific exonuclease RecJ n=2 Tax=unclassified Sphaerochaeta TaxID=2637943 RepID=UPI002A36146F|nr:single-stranded-DNA-specific exonuclease RecJ [Sphaerochaeta sp.]MCK9598978.1 single-stranded-DNA-specific exonuclease RecJ [Sphaerochaeta sp.]MDX9825028.1 single-stranded-DNA-specific exonuclease RecJ [Sphaerochaeta sp.]
MVWKKLPVSAQEMRRLHEQYGLDVLSASILARRGQTSSEQVKFFLEQELTYLHNPFLFDDMEEVVDRINEAVAEGEKVCVIGDRDVDGITSTALLVQELRSMGLDVSYQLPEGDDPYGMTLSGVDKAHEDKVTLMITVDCGISNFAEIAHAHSLGIDTIVLDHHISGNTLPPALAIIDPKMPGSGYPFEHLAGCGVVAKVIWALRFSQTDFYREECLLLHAQPGHDTIIIQAMRIQNLLVIDRVIEEVNPGLISVSQSKVLSFLSCGLPILVLDAQAELVQLKQAFGKKVDVHLVEMRPQMEAVMPVMKNKGLFALSNLSRAIKYSSFGRDELQVLYTLFIAYCMKRYPSLDSDYESILDLVAIGTVADLMPMEDENRILVKRGLKVLTQGRRESLLPLFSMQNLLGKQLSTSDISWQISPVINASGRMGKPSVALEMMLSTDPGQAEELAGQLLRLNKERQKLGEDAWTRLLSMAKESFEASGSKLVVVEDSTLSRGITGVMASRLLKQFNAPAIVLATVGEERVSASMRSPDSFNAREFLSRFSDLFLDYGGHACAGGFSMDVSQLKVFKQRVMDEIDTMDCLPEEVEEVTIDCTLPEAYMTPDIIKVVEFFEPYGEKNPPLVLLMEGAVIENIQVMNNKNGSVQHVKMTLAFGQYKWPALYWSAADRIGKDFDVGTAVDIVFRLGRNYFRNQESLQITIIDLKPTA